MLSTERGLKQNENQRKIISYKRSSCTSEREKNLAENGLEPLQLYMVNILIPTLLLQCVEKTREGWKIK